MQLNIQSILAHQQELNQLLCTLEKKGTRSDIVLLCETFLTLKMEKMVHVPGYTHVGNHRPSRKGRGVSTLLNNNISFKRSKDLDVFEEGLIESIFIEMIATNGKKLVVGSMYKQPNIASKPI